MKQLIFVVFILLTPRINAQSCPFCQIISGKSKQLIIKESANVMAVRKDRPVMCGQNFLIISKKHYTNLSQTDPKVAGQLLAEMVKMVQEFAAIGKQKGQTGHFSITMNNGIHSEKSMAQEMAERDKNSLCTSALELNTDIISTQSVAHMHMHVTSADTDWGFKQNQ